MGAVVRPLVVHDRVGAGKRAVEDALHAGVERRDERDVAVVVDDRGATEVGVRTVAVGDVVERVVERGGRTAPSASDATKMHAKRRITKCPLGAASAQRLQGEQRDAGRRASRRGGGLRHDGHRDAAPAVRELVRERDVAGFVEARRAERHRGHRRAEEQIADGDDPVLLGIRSREDAPAAGVETGAERDGAGAVDRRSAEHRERASAVGDRAGRGVGADEDAVASGVERRDERHRARVVDGHVEAEAGVGSARVGDDVVRQVGPRKIPVPTVLDSAKYATSPERR